MNSSKPYLSEDNYKYSELKYAQSLDAQSGNPLANFSIEQILQVIKNQEKKENRGADGEDKTNFRPLPPRPKSMGLSDSEIDSGLNQLYKGNIPDSITEEEFFPDPKMREQMRPGYVPPKRVKKQQNQPKIA